MSRLRRPTGRRRAAMRAREEEKGEMDQSQAIVGALVRARNEQLDWCIHDLTPATFEAYQAKKEKKPATRLSATAKQFKFNVAALELTPGDS